MEDKSTVKERLQIFLRQRGITKSEFSRIMGLSPAYVGSMRKSMPAEKVKKLLEHFPDLNREWLLYGEGEMCNSDDSTRPKSGKRSSGQEGYMVPLIPSGAAAGRFPMLSDGVDFDDCEKVLSPDRAAQCAIRVVGDSMEPEIHDGSLLFLSRINSTAFIPWGHPMVLDTENGPLVKVLYPCDDDKECIKAVSYNKDYPPLKVPAYSIYNIYRIVATVVPGRTF